MEAGRGSGVMGIGLSFGFSGYGVEPLAPALAPIFGATEVTFLFGR